MAEEAEALKGSQSLLASPNTVARPTNAEKRARDPEASKSTDPLVLDIKLPPSGPESNRSERHKDAVLEVKRERSYSQTHDGVFSNLSAKPEVMVLPAGSPDASDAPPVHLHSLLIGC